MKLSWPKKLTIIMIVGTILSLSLVVFVHYSEACRLKSVVVDNDPIENWQKRYEMLDQSSIISQPLDAFSAHLLAKKSIHKIDLTYSHPGSLEIELNNFNPVCVILDRVTGHLFGLDKQARLISLRGQPGRFDNPVLTSVMTGHLFKRCDDSRVKVVIEQLSKIRDDNIDLYYLIDEIDFGNQDFLKVAIAGLPFRLKVNAGDFSDEIDRFVEFHSGFAPDLNEINLIDMRFGQMIITSGRDR